MPAYESRTVPIETVDGAQLNGTFYRAKNGGADQATLLYFHGGGLIFGHREDLPQVYLDMLTDNGYNVLALDYLLAPESKLPAIMQSVQRGIEWFLANAADQLHVDPSRYYLMGRSAGAYLALYHAVHAPVRPQGVIALYGYYTLHEASFNVPNRHFLSYPQVSEAMMQSLISQQPLATSPSDQRYLLYLAVRQRGNWIPFISNDPADASTYALTKEQLAALPPSFLAAANGDPDVPVRQSKMLHKFIPNSELHLVESAEHDFDRTQIQEFGTDLYERLIAWLNTRSSTP